jgi:hypothetical protein
VPKHRWIVESLRFIAMSAGLRAVPGVRQENDIDRLMPLKEVIFS